VRRHAKASSPGSTSGGGDSLGSSFRGATTARNAPGDAEGIGAPSRRPTHFALGVLVAVLTLLALASSAMAFTTRYPKIASFGLDGTSSGFFNSPGALALDQADEKLFALDLAPIASPTLHAFDLPAHTSAGGTFPLTIATTGNFPGIAVDNSGGAAAGNVYYVSTQTRKIYGFSSAGSALGGNFPVSVSGSGELDGAAVDSGGNIYTSDISADAIRKYDSLGNPLGTISLASIPVGINNIAFDSNDDMFVSSGANVVGFIGGVWKLTAPTYDTATKIVPAPTSGVAVDAIKHQLYAIQDGGLKVSAYSTDGTPLYEFASSIPKESLRGIAVDQGADEIYVSDSGGRQVYVFGPAQNFANASATLVPAKNVTGDAAEIGATVTDNNILPTNWRLELSSDGGASWSTVSSGQTAGGQTGVAVSGTATGLTPNTADYRFRVVTNKGTDAATEAVSSSLSFKTIAPPPVVTDVGAVDITDASVRLAGTIDPRNTDAGYVFEYGTTPALGSSTAPVGIGGGTTPVTVSQVITGLTPDTTYYFKLVATNLSGSTSSSGQAVHTRATPLPLPEDRGWEMVTPPDKNLGGADRPAGFGNPQAAVAQNGQAAAFCTAVIFGELAPQMTHFCASYVSSRGPGGWRTEGVTPRICAQDIVAPGGEATKTYLSQNFDHAVVKKPESADCSVPPLDPAAPLPPAGSATANLYREDFTSDPFGISLLAPNLGDFIFGGGSDDFSHVVYVSEANQTGDSPAQGDFSKLYEWDNGSLKLVSKDPSDVPFETPSNYPANYPSATATALPSAISEDGERIYFQNPTFNSATVGHCTATCEVYMRESATTTYDVSASECTVSCGTDQSDEFQWASPNGAVAFFTSCAKLTDTSAATVSCGTDGALGAKLYRWDRNAPPGHRLIDLTVDHEPADGAQPTVQGLIGASDDGNTAYFVASGQIVAGESAPSSVGIYRWRWNGGSPDVEFLGSLSHTYDPFSGSDDSHNWIIEHRRVTPDGKYLLISTGIPLVPAVDRDSDRDVYRWDEQNGWICVSCQAPGAPSAGDSNDDTHGSPPIGLNDFGPLSNHDPIITMSNDGRVFFETPDALVPEDVNGEAGCPLLSNPTFVRSCQDVYEWNEGRVSLLSSGIGGDPSYLIGSGASGGDVFFFTRQRLVGWDTDDGTDIYDARVGGGFPEPPPRPPVCDLNAGACEGPGASAPTTALAGSAVFQGPGNPTPKHHPGAKHKKHRKHSVKRGHKRAQRRTANHNRRAGR